MCRLLLPPQTFILWFGWYGFNAGSILSLTLDDRYLIASHATINTTLSAAARLAPTSTLGGPSCLHFKRDPG